MANVLIFCETKDGKFKAVTRELCSAARKLAASLGGRVIAVNLGEEVADAAALGSAGAGTVIQVTNPGRKSYATEGDAQVAADLIRAENPAVVLFAATARGRDLAPRVAARIGRPLLSDCTDVRMEGGELRIQRPIYAGKVLLWC
jgi:electron transfer flavoprotein alpha subunit